MKIQFLGSGSAFVEASENYHSNILFSKEIEEKQYSGSENNTIETGTEIVTRRLLFDAGHHIQESLKLQDKTVFDIDSIFISHAHGDHIFGLEFIGFKTYFTPPFGSNKIQLLGNERILTRLWDNVLSGTMKYINGAELELKDYFNPLLVPQRHSFKFANIDFTPIQVPHVITQKEEIPAYGISFKDNGVNVFLTGDTIADFWRLMGQYEKADVIFHEVEFANYPNPVHSQYHQLKEYPEKYKKKMFLYHYMLGDKTFEELEAEVISDGFAGLIKRGQTFDTAELAKC